MLTRFCKNTASKLWNFKTVKIYDLKKGNIVIKSTATTSKKRQ